MYTFVCLPHSEINLRTWDVLFFFFNVDLFICFWLHRVSVAVWAFSLVVASGGYSLAVARRLLLLQSTGSREPLACAVAAHELRSCGSWAPEHKLHSCDIQASWPSQVAVVEKNPPTNAGDMTCGFNPWVRKIPWWRAWLCCAAYRSVVCDPMGCSWNSPGKYTGVGCHALLQEIFPAWGSNQVFELQVDSLLPEPPWKPINTGVCCLSLLRGIFPTQELNRGLLHCRQILYHWITRGALEMSF